LVQAMLARGVKADGPAGTMALRDAARGGHQAVLELLLAQGADAKAQSSTGESALLLAMESNLPGAAKGQGTAPPRTRRDLARALLERGAAVDARNSRGETALMRAVTQGDLEAVRLLLERGADPNVKTPGGQTVLSDAACSDPALARLLLDQGADPQAGTALMRAIDCSRGETVAALLGRGAAAPADALTAAVRTGNRTVIRALLAKGADAAALPKDAWNTLVLAAVQGQEALVEALGRPGVEIDCEGNAGGLLQGGTLLIRATTQGDRELVTWLLDLGAAVKDRHGATALVAALEHQHPQIARILIARGADVNGQDRDGHTPLALAAGKGDAAMVKVLLDRGAEVNARSARGETALLCAVRGRRFDLAAALLARGADINSGGGALAEAASDDDRETLRWLLDQGADVNAVEPPGTARAGLTALMMAAQAGRREALDLLLARGAAVDAKTGTGRTALIGAADAGQLANVATLLDHGADVNARFDAPPDPAKPQDPPDGGTALTVAARRGDLTLVRLLLARGAAVEARGRGGQTALWTAGANGDGALVAALLAGGADPRAAVPNPRGPGATSTLMAAVLSDDLASVRALIAHGVDVNAGASQGETALLLALRGASATLAQDRDIEQMRLVPHSADPNAGRDMVQMLLAQGADPNAGSDGGERPLMAAAERGDLGLVQALLAQGADVNAKGINNHTTALIRAVQRGQVDIALLLLAQGADPNAGSEGGERPLMVAAERGDLDLVQALLARGADVNAKDINISTALIRAVQRGRVDVVNLLLAQGADPETLSYGNQTPLRLAARDGQSAVVEALLDRGARITPEALAVAVIGGHVDTVKRLIARGANVNARIIEDHHRDWLVGLIKGLDYILKRCRQEAPTGGGLRISCDGGRDFDGVPPVLSIAAARGDRDLVQVLLDAGARVDARDAAGRNALSFAIGFDQTGGEIGVVPLLLARGAAVLPADLGAALLAAVRDGRHDWLKALLDQGTPSAGKGVGRGTGVAAGPLGAAALLAAAWRGDVESVRLLLDYGAAAEARPDTEESPLRMAAGKGHPEVVRLLLVRGAAVEARDRDGRTALMIAVAQRQAAAVGALLDHGADVDAKVTVAPGANRRGAWAHAGWTALMFAAEQGDATLVKALLARGAAVDVKAADHATTALSLASARSSIAGLLRQAGAKE
jgi:ankyrin repeat protein